MKKILAAILLLTVVLGLCACGSKASCGDSHTWEEWRITEPATNYTPCQMVRSCEKCDAEEAKKDFDKMFRYYAELLRWIPFFTEAERLQQNLDGVISAAFFGDVPVQSAEGDHSYQHTIKVSDLDAFTKKVFGCTYDYTGVADMWVLYESQASYNAEEDAIVIRAAGAGDESPHLSELTYEISEGGTYMVTAVFSFYEETFEKSFCVVEKDGNYVISTY